jgi:hypothetical protein
MAIITRARLSSIAQEKAGYRGVKTIVDESKSASRLYQVTTIFLSHSHTDNEVVEQAVTFFRTLGVSIYVDWMDDTMASSPSGATAEKIKSKIKENDKFIFLATNAAVNSKWCNWEVGVGDTFKLPSKKISLFPLADNNVGWNGNEYFQIYPRIEEVGGSYYVYYPDNSFEALITWLKR